MREILFRGKRLDSGAWELGDLSHDYCKVGDTCISKCSGFVQVDPSTIGQCTGLTGKNGVKIFEGDILIFIDPDLQEFDDNERFVVRWYEYAPGFLLELFCGGNATSWEEIDRMHAANFEIIGNIHDNQELLEGGAGA